MADAMQDGLATKADLATVRSDLAAVASDLAATEARLLREIEATKFDILKWVFGAIGFQTRARAVCASELTGPVHRVYCGPAVFPPAPRVAAMRARRECSFQVNSGN